MFRRRFFGLTSSAILLVALALLAIAFPILGWWYMTRPEVLLHADSPDGRWSATVIRQQTSIVGNTDVILQVENQSGKVIWRRRIDETDLWSDVDRMLMELLIDDRRVRVGPNYWGDGVYFELSKIDAEAGREVPTHLNAPGPGGPTRR